MAEENNKAQELSDRLDKLLAMHNEVSTEIDSLRVEIIRLKVEEKSKLSTTDRNTSEIISTPEAAITKDEVVESEITEDKPLIAAEDDYFANRKKSTFKTPPQINPKKNFDIEKLIGENLINKIGILVLIIGVAIGGKYSIENDLISPLGRIVLGYAVGIVLLILGMRLKKKYLNFSAVLVSGAMSILYFITFFAFNFYQLIGQEIAFGLMVIFTIFTVLSALNFDKQIIAHLGLVGAISVPFLLSNDTGNVVFLFSYLTLINLAIAFISMKKNWKFLFYSAFTLTWLVFFSWLIFSYKSKEDFTLAFSFLTIFFVLFYIIFIAYKLLNLKKYTIGDIIILLLNSLIFFSIGYGFLSSHDTGKELVGVFAICNAIIHFIAAYIINKRKLADKNLFYLIIGLVIVCLTIAIPIQLTGHWITMMWFAEAALLFYIGRSRHVGFYEYLSFAMMAVAVLSLIHDWSMGYTSITMIDIYHMTKQNSNFAFLFNPIFLNSIVSCLSFGLIYWIHSNGEWRNKSKIGDSLLKILAYVIPIAFLLIVFFSFRHEISHYFGQLYAASKRDTGTAQNFLNANSYNVDIKHRANVWLINYSILFISIISFIVIKKVKNIKANWAMVVVNMLVIGSFLIQGLYELSELRENYLTQHNADFYVIDNSFLVLRYISFAFLAILVALTYHLLKKSNNDYKIYAVAESLFYCIVLWILTSELIHWLDFTERSEIYGLALSIFWGIFSVVIISLGIWKKKKHLRILGIVIFTITLVKLFFYDLANLNTISKTIVMISLGALLLLTSFLYNKYTIEDEELL